MVLVLRGGGVCPGLVPRPLPPPIAIYITASCWRSCALPQQPLSLLHRPPLPAFRPRPTRLSGCVLVLARGCRWWPCCLRTPQSTSSTATSRCAPAWGGRRLAPATRVNRRVTVVTCRAALRAGWQAGFFTEAGRFARLPFAVAASRRLAGHARRPMRGTHVVTGSLASRASLQHCPALPLPALTCAAAPGLAAAAGPCDPTRPCSMAGIACPTHMCRPAATPLHALVPPPPPPPLPSPLALPCHACPRTPSPPLLLPPSLPCPPTPTPTPHTIIRCGSRVTRGPSWRILCSCLPARVSRPSTSAPTPRPPTRRCATPTPARAGVCCRTWPPGCRT